MIAGATDSALMFLLKVLPSVEIPKLEGVKDGNMYSIEDLSLNGFMLKKEDIDVQIAGISTNAYATANATANATATATATSTRAPTLMPQPANH